jgi:hypothetical protein
MTERLRRSEKFTESHRGIFAKKYLRDFAGTGATLYYTPCTCMRL